MFTSLFLVSLGALLCHGSTCDYVSGHGMVVVSSEDCLHFIGHHLGEFECPHQYDVKVVFRFANPLDRQRFCQLMAANATQTVYTIAPELVLPDLFAGKVKAFSSDVTDGFFGETLMANVSFIYEKTLYAAAYGVLRPHTLTYLILPDGGNGTFLMWHYISTPPDFDHVLRVVVTTPEFSFPAGHEWAMIVQFPSLANDYSNRLTGGYIQGFVNGTQSVTIKVMRHIYPSFRGYNGDGRTDFAQYCVEPNRPKWPLCP